VITNGNGLNVIPSGNIGIQNSFNSSLQNISLNGNQAVGGIPITSNVVSQGGTVQNISSNQRIDRLRRTVNVS
jgi:hypothetical protein